MRKIPQHNGLAERMDKPILERVRSILSTSGLSKVFWPKAVVTTVYLINKCLSSTISFKTPQELSSSIPFNYEYLRIFNCVVYAHINEEKLKPRALKYIFLSYLEGFKGYKIWIDEFGRHKYFIRKDVVFNESNMAILRKIVLIESLYKNNTWLWV